MSSVKWLPEWLLSLMALILLSAAVAPWLAGFSVLAAPSRQTDAALPTAGSLEENNSISKQKLIALTFDDGPRRLTTSALLDGLSQRGVSATFFLIGNQLEDNEDLIERMDQEGHQIGIHTYDHISLAGLSQKDFSAQVDRTRQILTNILQHNGFFLRPPFGFVDEGIRKNAGCPIILWSIDPEDWRDQNTARVVQFVVSHAQDGDIILMHDIFPESVDAALQIIDRLHSQGFLFVTVEQLFNARHITLKDGETYDEAHP